MLIWAMPLSTRFTSLGGRAWRPDFLSLLGSFDAANALLVLEGLDIFLGGPAVGGHPF